MRAHRLDDRPNRPRSRAFSTTDRPRRSLARARRRVPTPATDDVIATPIASEGVEGPRRVMTRQSRPTLHGPLDRRSCSQNRLNTRLADPSTSRPRDETTMDDLGLLFYSTAVYRYSILLYSSLVAFTGRRRRRGRRARGSRARGASRARRRRRRRRAAASRRTAIGVSSKSLDRRRRGRRRR